MENIGSGATCTATFFGRRLSFMDKADADKARFYMGQSLCRCIDCNEYRSRYN